MKTFLAKKETVQPKWYLIDAAGVPLGRLCVKAANMIRGRHKPSYTPSVDTGDYVVVINAEKVALTGAKLEQKKAYRHSGFPGGLKSTSYTELLAKSPAKAVEKAVRGMLPHTTLGREQLTHLKVYAGSEHPHSAQKPVPFEITQVSQ